MTVNRTGLAAGVSKTLEEKISDALMQLPPERNMIDTFPDEHDRAQAYQRLLINTVLMKVLESDALRLSRLADMDRRISPPEWQRQAKVVGDLYADVAQACAGFAHDAALLDMGANAERTLTKSKAKRPKTIEEIKARRKVLLAIVFVGEMDLNITEEERIAEAAAVADIKHGTLRTRVRDMRKALEPAQDPSKKALFSKAECEMFREYKKKYSALGRDLPTKSRIKLLKYVMFGHL